MKKCHRHAKRFETLLILQSPAPETPQRPSQRLLQRLLQRPCPRDSAIDSPRDSSRWMPQRLPRGFRLTFFRIFSYACCQFFTFWAWKNKRFAAFFTFFRLCSNPLGHRWGAWGSKGLENMRQFENCSKSLVFQTKNAEKHATGMRKDAKNC